MLLEGRLWKCPQIANLRPGGNLLPARNEWGPYLAYEGIDVSCSDAELQAHIRGGREPGRLCPANPEPYEKDIHNIDFDIPDARRAAGGNRHP